MNTTLRRELLMYFLLLVLGGIAVAGIAAATGGPETIWERTMSDTVGGKWQCVPAGTFKGFETVDCTGMQTLMPDRNNGGVRAFVIGEDLVTFRVTRWGDTPAGPALALESGSR